MRVRGLRAAGVAVLIWTLGAGAAAAEVVWEAGSGFRMRTTDDRFAAQLGGRIQADAAFYDDDRVSLGNGTEIRRARLFVKAKLFRDWGLKLQLDFAASASEIRDAYIDYNGFDWGRVRLGNFKQPFSIENMTSSKYVTFIERPLAHNALTPGRRIGAALFSGGNSWGGSVGVFGETVDSDAPGEEDASLSAAARLTWAPVATDRSLLHAGGSVFHRKVAENQPVRFRSRPETHVTGVRLVDTGSLANADHRQAYVAELAGAVGPWHWQGEYHRTSLDRQSGSPDADFGGWYVQTGWFVTGESRAAAYDVRSGSFGRITPRNGGAWEVAARYSTLDLTDGTIAGGEEDNVTLGINWHPNKYLRFSANYGRVLSVDGGMHDGDEPEIFQMRAQVDF